MSKRHLFILGGVFLLGACARQGDQFGDLKAIVSRGPENQPLLTVVGEASPAQRLTGDDGAHPADRALVEKEGFTAATDRWIQMDMLRRLTRGQLAEVLGGRKSQSIPDETNDYQTDRLEDAAFLRDMEVLGVGLEESVQNSWDRIQKESPETRDLLLSYTEGVNKFLARMDELKPTLKRQYALATRNPSYRPRAWEPQDSLAISAGVTFHLSSSLEEKLRLGIIRFLVTAFENGPKSYSKFLDLRPIEDSFILAKTFEATKPVRESIGPDPLKNLIFQRLFGAVKYDCKEQGFPLPSCERRAAFGSNNAVVSKAFSETGETYLFNDPHLPLTFYNFFYEVGLNSQAAGGTIKSAGVKPPGVPLTLIGHNDHMGWGVTNNGADVDDLYLETFTSTAHDKYTSVTGKTKAVTYKEYPRLVRQLDGSVRERIIKVGFTEHGPIFSDQKPELRGQLAQVERMIAAGFNLHVGISYKWTGHPGTTEMPAIVNLNRARNFDEFKTALKQFETGAQNFVYADKKGNVGYYAHANYPVRPWLSIDTPPYSLLQSTKMTPLEWNPEFRATVPEQYQSEGFIVTANNDPFGHSRYPNLADFDDYFGFGFTDGLRAFRIKNLLEERKAQNGRITARDMQEIQLDKRDELGAHFIALLENAKVQEGLSESAKGLATLLMEWNRSGCFASADSHPALAFNQWLPALMYEYFSWERLKLGEPSFDVDIEVFKDVYATAMNKMYRSSPMLKTLYHKVKGKLTSENAEEFADGLALINKTLEAATAEIEKAGLQHTTLGETNRLSFVNVLEGFLPQVFSLGLKRGGSWETVDPAGPGFGANFRMVLSLKEDAPIKAQIILPGGNHDPLENIDAIVRELTQWRDGELRPMADFN